MVLARNLFQPEHRERKPQIPERKFACIAGGKLLDANREPQGAQQTNPQLRVAHHVSEKSQQSSPKCKGMFFKHEGKWDQMWMVKWLDWYKYVIAFSRRYISSGIEHNPVSSRAESAKTAWSS